MVLHNSITIPVFKIDVAENIELQMYILYNYIIIPH